MTDPAQSASQSEALIVRLVLEPHVQPGTDAVLVTAEEAERLRCHCDGGAMGKAGCAICGGIVVTEITWRLRDVR